MPRRKKGKVAKVLREFKEGKLKSGSGHEVVKHAQAMAIALSEARKAGERVKTKKRRKK